MCLLAICETKNIPEENFREAFRKNGDGFGFAWRNKDKVNYLKGMMTADAAWATYKTFSKENIFPHVIHFRLGKPTMPELTHPFEVTEDSKLNLSNTISGDLLFHNGVITCWKDRMFEMFSMIKRIPEGPIIDTRVAAIMLSIYGKRIFDFVDGKFVIFGPKNLESIGTFENVNGVKYSNDSYKVYQHKSGFDWKDTYKDYTVNRDLWGKDEIDEFIV